MWTARTIYLAISVVLNFSLAALSPAIGADYSFTVLPDVPGASANNTFANGINDGDQVVGHFSCGLSCGIHGFRLSGGNFTIIDVPGAKFTAAYGTNKAGQIVGEFATFDDVHHGFLRATGGGFTTFDVPGAASITQPRGINADGQIAGWYADAAQRAHGFLLSAGRFTTIDVEGAANTYVQGINDSGQIVGYTCCIGGATHGFLLSGGVFTTIDLPGGFQTVANGITNDGRIVGTYFDAAFREHGFVRDPSGSFKTLDPPGSVGTDARGTNNAGQIVGTFGNGQAGHSFLASAAADCTSQVTVNAFDPIATLGLNSVIVAGQLSLFTVGAPKGVLIESLEKPGTTFTCPDDRCQEGIQFVADVSIADGAIPIPEIHIRYIQNETAWSGTLFYFPGPDKIATLKGGISLPLLDRLTEPPPAFYEANFVEENPAGPDRIVRASDSPLMRNIDIHVPVSGQLQRVDVTDSFTMFLGCYDDHDPTFRTVAALDWSVRFKGSLHPRPPTFIEDADAGITTEPFRFDGTSPQQDGPLANGSSAFIDGTP